MADPSVRVRCYNVGFGDCFLVSFFGNGDLWQMLIDFGNAPTNSNAIFQAIANDIFHETGGRLDVVVLTHEHLDHLEGFYSQRKVFNRMEIGQVWMGLPSQPDYYDLYPNAEPIKKLRTAAEVFLSQCEQRNLALAPSFYAILANNLTNKERIDYVRGLSHGSPVRYFMRGDSIPGDELPQGMSIQVLAPEADQSVYYRRSSAEMALYRRGLLGMAPTERDVDQEDRRWLFRDVPRDLDEVPDNLSPADWRQLRNGIRTGAIEGIRALDKAENNTSLVLLIEFAGKRLLFPGDAELESWTMMGRHFPAQLRDIDFLKVSHHGSHNGTPVDQLDTLLPVSRKRQATVMVSTMSKVYGTQNPVPDRATLQNLKSRCRQLISTDGNQNLFVDAHL